MDFVQEHWKPDAFAEFAQDEHSTQARVESDT